MKRLNKGLFAILLTMSMVSTTAVFAEETTPTPTPTASIEVMEGEEEVSTPTEETIPTLSENATAFISNVNEAELNRDNILTAAQEYVDAYVASFDAEGEEATAAADALIVEKEDAFFNLFDQGALLDAYDALSEDEKNNEEVINAKALLDALIADVDTIMNMEEPSDDPITYSAGVIVGSGVPTTIDMSLVTGDVVITSTGLQIQDGSTNPAGVIAIEETALNTAGYEFTGTTNDYHIHVNEGVTTTLILNNLTINSDDIYVTAEHPLGGQSNPTSYPAAQRRVYASCIDVSRADVTMILKGNNVLTYNSGTVVDQCTPNGAALEKSGMTGTLVVKEDPNTPGKLTATGVGFHDASFGNSMAFARSAGKSGVTNITIESGTIVAQAGNHTPGIGSVCTSNTGGGYTKNINITGGNVTAYGGVSCSGIGSGYGVPVNGIHISNGAIVTAYGGQNSPGIGSGGRTVSGAFWLEPVEGFNSLDTNDITISGGSTIVTAFGDQATNMPGIGSGAMPDGITTGNLTNVVASPNVPNWATYIKYGTSATSYKFTTDADVNGANESLATPINVSREFATFLKAKKTDGVNVYYTQVYFGLPYDEFASTDKADMGANSFSTCAGSFTWANAAAAKTSLLSSTKVGGHDQNGAVLSATSFTTNDAQIQAIYDANENSKTGNYPLTFTYNYTDAGDGQPRTMSVTVYVQFRDACTPTSGAYPNIAASNAVHPTGGAAFTKAELIGLTEGTANNFLGLNADLLVDVTLTQSEVDAINAAKVANQTGVFPLTYTYVTTTDGTTPVTLTKTVYVTLTDTGTPFTPKDPTHPEKGQNMGPQIGANDYITKTGGAAFDTTTLKKIQNVSAKDSNGTSIPLDKLIPDPTQLAAINAAKTSGQVGDFPLKYTFEDVDGTIREVETTVKLRDNEGTTPTPVEKKDDNNKVIGYVISTPELGSNNHTTPTGGTGWTADEIKTLLDVVGKDAKGVEIPRTDFTVDATQLATLNAEKLAGKCGRYPVKFTGPNGETVTSYVTLTGCPVPPPTSKPIPGPFLVTYLDCYGNTVKVEWVNYGGSSTKPNNNYPDIVNVSENKEVHPNNCAYNVPNTGV